MNCILWSFSGSQQSYTLPWLKPKEAATKNTSAMDLMLSSQRIRVLGASREVAKLDKEEEEEEEEEVLEQKKPEREREREKRGGEKQAFPFFSCFFSFFRS